MAIPQTISGVVIPVQGAWVGPILQDGAYYTFLIDSTLTDEIEAYKVSDPSSGSFAEQDAAGRPNLGGAVFSICAIPDPSTNTIWIMQQNDGGTADFTCEPFNTASHGSNADQWGTQEVLDSNVDFSAAFGSALARVSGVERDDGVLAVLSSVDNQNFMGTKYDRIGFSTRSTGGTWTFRGYVQGTSAAEYWTSGTVIKGSSSRVIGLFELANNGTIYGREMVAGFGYIPASDPGTSIDTTTHGTTHLIAERGVSYDDGGTLRMRAAYIDADQKISIIKTDDPGDDTTSPTYATDTAVSDNTVEQDAQGTNINLTAALAVDTKELQLLYANDADQDLYRDVNNDDAGWGTDTEEQDAVTINFISSNVYGRGGGTYLAMILDDGGAIKYDEIELAAPPAGVSIPVAYHHQARHWRKN